MSISRYGIEIGPLNIHYYGVILLLGALCGLMLFIRVGRKRGLAADTAWEMFPWGLVGGVIGARLWHVLMPSSSSGITFIYYLQHPLEMLKIWNGGLGIAGAVIGGAVGVWLFCRKYGFPFLKQADAAAPALALSQAVGRWGNFVNQELYGKPSTLPWAIWIDPQNRIAGYEDVATYHPLFLYESLYNLLNVLFLLWADRHFEGKFKDGDLFCIYLISYPLGRFMLEFLRLDPSMLGGLNANQLIMASVAIISAIILILRHTRATVFAGKS